MKEKRVIILFLIFVILSSVAFIHAAEAKSGVENAYSCLKAQMGDNCGATKNTARIVFNLLAMAYDSKVQSDCKSALDINKNKDNCWGDSDSGVCRIKTTAMAIIGLNYINEKTDGPKDWIISKRKSNTGLKWFLEIDADNVTKCKVNGNEITIDENKKITSSNPSGLISAYNSYWFEINDINKNYTISCNRAFTTTLLYQKPGSSVLYIPNNPHSASASDSTVEKVDSYCLSTSSGCSNAEDYEGTLWATIALAKIGEDVSPYIPYLSAFADDAANKKYFPSAFLYMLTNEDEYSSQLISLQQQGKFWGDSSAKLYSTALALLALGNTERDEVKNAKDYLISPQVQGVTGCWDENTAFILYAVWPKSPASAGPVVGPSTPDCEDAGFYCIASTKCSQNNQIEGNFYCPGFDICCKVQPAEESCREKGGIECQDNERCTDPTVESVDVDKCCIADCIEIIENPTNECEDKNYNCRASCLSSETEDNVYSGYCGAGKKCCKINLTPVKNNKWLLIALLVVLILLVLLATIFRNQLKIWLFRMKSGFKSKKGPSPANRPAFPPPGFRPMPPRQMAPYRPPAPRMYGRPSPSATSRMPGRDKDFEDTMKKLKDMSK